MKAIRTLTGVIGLLAFFAGALNTPLNMVIAKSPVAITIQVGVAIFLAYSVGRAKSKDRFSWSEEIIWAITELVLFLIVVLTPIPLGGFLSEHTSELCVLTGLTIFVSNLTQ